MGEKLSAEAYEELVEHTADILMVVDESGTIQYESPSVQRITGYAPEERAGGNAFEHVHPDDQEKVRETFATALESSEDKVIGTEFRFRHKDGSWVWLESRGGDRTLTAVDGFVVSLRDISQRKEYEQQLEQERDRLDRFAGVVSHDLRNPLNVIEGHLELAQEECNSEHLESIEAALDRVDALIENLLTLTREGDSEPQLDAVALRGVIRECWQNLRTGEASLNIETENRIVADENQLIQVFENLFRNAIKHGGEDVTITLGEMDDGFYVADDGSGIPEDVRSSSLEYGFSSESDGTGFGLSIVREIVASHGWNLNVTNGSEGGARFEISGVESASD